MFYFPTVTFWCVATLT